MNAVPSSIMHHIMELGTAFIYPHQRKRFLPRLNWRGHRAQKKVQRSMSCGMHFIVFLVQHEHKTNETLRCPYVGLRRKLRVAWWGLPLALYWWQNTPEVIYKTDWLLVIIRCQLQSVGLANKPALAWVHVCSIQVTNPPFPVIYLLCLAREHNFILWNVQEATAHVRDG